MCFGGDVKITAWGPGGGRISESLSKQHGPLDCDEVMLELWIQCHLLCFQAVSSADDGKNQRKGGKRGAE